MVVPSAPPSKQAIAEALFQQGRELLAEGKVSEACPKFAESQRIEPATGTLLNLAACHETEGKCATAWSEFNEALGAAQRDQRADRVDFARQHINALEAKCSRVVIRVAEQTRQEAVQVRLDGVAVGRAGWGVAIPVDPGKHVIMATLEGMSSWNRVLFVGPSAGVVDVEVPAWPSPRPSPAASSVPRPMSNTRLAAYVTGGVGAAALVVGGAFGWRAFSKWRDADDACPTGRDCSAGAIDDRGAAVRAATVADVSFGVGLAALAVSTYLWVTSSPRHDLQHEQARMHWTPVLGAGSAGMNMEATW